MSNKAVKFSGISLIRVLATLGIMLYHIGYGLYYFKFLNLSAGVHIFFCISAFLVMYSTQNKTAKKFLIGRIIRIIPLYVLLTVATFAGAKFIANLGQGDMTIGELICSLFLIPYAREGLTGENVIRPIVGPAWTLYYEIWFAVIVSVAMKIKHKARGIISAAVCVTLYVAALIIPGNLPVLRLLRTGFMLDFAAGITVFWIWKHCSAYFSRIPRFIWGSLIAILCTFFYLGPRNIFLLCATAAIILLCSISALDGKGIIRPVSFFADISYSFYLLHYYIIIIVGIFFDLSTFSLKTIIGTFIVFAVTFICAIFSHLLIEKKLGSSLIKLIK